MLFKNKFERLAAVATTGLIAASSAMAEAPAQPDVGEVVTYILGSVATIALIGNASLVVRVSMRVYNWVRAAIR